MNIVKLDHSWTVILDKNKMVGTVSLEVAQRNILKTSIENARTKTKAVDNELIGDEASRVAGLQPSLLSHMQYHIRVLKVPSIEFICIAFAMLQLMPCTLNRNRATSHWEQSKSNRTYQLVRYNFCPRDGSLHRGLHSLVRSTSSRLRLDEPNN